ncbi:epithelial-stromal interaction protein 1 [Microcaecilia unicolor]|uniref:Epithelial-stromal interaction protein 1 n=1 Tax=Microcaecilia unicolor TaxID=1415580 RepID=A0A6P7XQA7_9AMPH|nr:epithelial-stromal interaction protein 1 [Microcaecilia unicolor]
MYREAGGYRQDRGRFQEEQRPGHQLPEDGKSVETQQSRYASGYTLIPPNETRRNEIQRIARKELEDLERWKEEHRPGPINLAPKRIGGIETEANARQKQQNTLKLSKYQQKFNRDDYRRKVKEEEEAKILKMKAIQREKATRLEATRQQQDMQRKKECEEDKYVKNNDFLSTLESGLSSRRSCQNGGVGQQSTVWARSLGYQQTQKEEEERNLQQMKEAQNRKSDLLESKQRQKEKERKTYLQMEHRRVNNAFLDRLQGKSQSSDQPGHLRKTDGSGSESWVLSGVS